MPVLDDNLIPLEIYEKLFKYGYRGTFLGGCVERGEGSNIRRSAHCHNHGKQAQKHNGKYGGWICIKSSKPEKCVENGKLTPLFKHELAHLIAMARGGSGYGKGFKQACNELGLFRYGHKV